MDEIKIISSHGGAVREVVLNRPDKRNALSPPMFDELIRIFQGEPTAREQAVLVRSEGRVFCAGVDLSERIQNGWPQESPLVRLCEAMRTFPLPVVGAVQGDAVAGGCMLALHCDLIVAAEGARLAMPLAQLGIAPPFILTERTMDRVGPALGREMVLLGNPVSVERLAQHNVINAVVPRGRFDAEVEYVVDRLVRNAPLSLRAVKAALARIGEKTGATPLQAEDAPVRAALDSDDAREGMRARLERREPQFTGR